MRALYLILFLLPLISFGQIKECPLPAKKPYPYPMGYLEHIPALTPCSKKPPILIFLHGIGEGYNSVPLAYVARTGLPALLKAGKMPLDSFIVLCPQGPKYISVPAIKAFIAFAKTKYTQADTSRIYLTGLSGGSISGMNYLKEYRATAAVFMCGSSTPKYVCDSTILFKTPMWLFHGDADKGPNGVPPTGSTNLYKALKLCPEQSELRITIYAGVTHNCWDRTYNLSWMWKGKEEHNFNTSYKPDVRKIDQYDQDIYTWLLRH